MNDKERMEALLRLIGRDDELLEAIAQAIGDTVEGFSDFVDFAEFSVNRGENHFRKA